MTTLYMLDTNTLSYIVSGRSPAARREYRRLSSDPKARVAISVITEAEVRFGLEKRVVSEGRLEAIEKLLATLEILPWGSESAAVYANTLPRLQAEGVGISLMDLLIGAHAASSGAVLVTHDAVFATVAPTVGIHALVDWAVDV